MRLPSLRLAYLRGTPAGDAIGRALEELLPGKVLQLPPDLPAFERDEICDLVALFMNRRVHVSARATALPAGAVCLVTEPRRRPGSDGDHAEAAGPVEPENKEGVVLALEAPTPGRRRLGLSFELRRLRDAVVFAIGQQVDAGRLGEMATWAEQATDSPSTALRFLSAAHAAALANPDAAAADLVAEGLAETVGALLSGVDERVCEWALAWALAPLDPSRLVGPAAAILGEQAALRRALAAGLVEHLPDGSRSGDVLDLRRPLAVLGMLDDLSVPVELAAIAWALRRRLPRSVSMVFHRLLPAAFRPLGLDAPPPPPVFVGREAELLRLAALLEPANEVRAVVLCGAAGMGKSALAATFCRRKDDDREVIWLNYGAGPEAAWQRVALAFVAASPWPEAAPMLPPTPRLPDGRPTWLPALLLAVAAREAVLVIDDADAVSESQLPGWLPSGEGRCAVLVLSRQAQRVAQRERDAILVELPALDDASARELLTRKARLQDRAPRPDAIEQLVQTAQGHPLVLSVASAAPETTRSADLAEKSVPEEPAPPRAEPALGDLLARGLADLAPSLRAVVDALSICARSGSPPALVARLLGVEDASALLAEAAATGHVLLEQRRVSVHPLVAEVARRALPAAELRSRELSHARSVLTLLHEAPSPGAAGGLLEDELTDDALLALGRVTDRCDDGEAGLAELVDGLATALGSLLPAPPLVSQAILSARQAVLRATPRGTDQRRWADAQVALARALREITTGSRIDNIRRALDALQAALSVTDEASNPLQWARIQNDIGAAWQELPAAVDGDEGRYLSVKAYESALRVYTEAEHPDDWAMVQNNLGNTLIGFSGTEREPKAREAITRYQSVLRVYRPERDPKGWAMVQNNLGRAYLIVADSLGADSSERLHLAEEAERAFQSALQVYSPDADRVQWANLQGNLAEALAHLSPDDTGQSRWRAMQAYRAALNVLTRDLYPWHWARVQASMAKTLLDLPGVDRAKDLDTAIEALRGALTVYSADEFPDLHRKTRELLTRAEQERAALPPPPAASTDSPK